MKTILRYNFNQVLNSAWEEDFVYEVSCPNSTIAIRILARFAGLVVEHITVGCSFSQLFVVEPKPCVVNMGITFQDLTNHRISQDQDLASHWMHKTTGCLAEPKVPFIPFF